MKTYNILFIGNSYTYFNKMPTEYFEKIAESAGISVNISSVTRGGWTLVKHACEEFEEGAKIAALLRENKYDYVVLQEQSFRPATEFEYFLKGASQLLEKIKPNGATPFFYGTWGRGEGSVELGAYDLTHDSMTKKLVDAYDAAAKEFGCDVAQVGLAFDDVYKNHKEINLYDRDLSHPSKYGSYLAALTIFAKMFDFDVRSVAFDAGFTKEENEILKNAAYAAANRKNI
ncbi:MAG: hypothetical protein E7598_07725 [Ruminococcaceae bacterium]|nr:hypothetical protein [Oscillospiraceae bacterium]